MREVPGLLIEPKELQARLSDKNLLILDLSREAVYQQAHVPGAIFLDFKELVCGIPPATGKIPNAEKLSQLFSKIGLTESSHVIAYDDEGGGWAGRLIWTLDCIGHKKYSYLNGGIHAWLAEKMPVESTPNIARPSSYHVKINSSVKADKEFIQAHLQTNDMVVWDARSREEYNGTKSFASKAGHIPGAKHFEWTSGMDQQNSLKIKNLALLDQELAALGIDKNKIVVTHCQTHHRSGFTYLLGKILGFKDIRGYDGSWSEWGNDPNTPVEK